MLISKTKILAGLHCKKRLFLILNRPELAKRKKSPLAETGIIVGNQARQEFPGGVLVNRFQQDSDPFEETRSYLDEKNVSAIFEAGFRYQDTEVFVDILQRQGSRWNLIEVKSSTSKKDIHLPDVAVQYHVLRGAGLDVDHIRLMHLNNQYVYGGKDLKLLKGGEGLSI